MYFVRLISKYFIFEELLYLVLFKKNFHVQFLLLVYRNMIDSVIVTLYSVALLKSLLSLRRLFDTSSGTFYIANPVVLK